MATLSSWTWVLTMFMILEFSNAQFGKGPPRYNMDQLPETRFTCEGRLTGRYYADQETDCQMFHVCTKMNGRDVSNYRFLCPNGTVFDQEHQVCADYYQVVCLANIGTNPLGQIFELFKLNSKESTNRQEFGEAPIQDPDYIGQNSLGGGEDFQAEEYNNNKLAQSQNSLPYQSYEKPNAKNIFYQAVTTQRPTTTTERYVPPTTTTSRPRHRTTTTAEPIFRSPIPTSADSVESAEIDFSDFKSLNKFQNQFHRSYTQRPVTTDRPSTTTPEQYYTSTTYAPYVEYSTEQRYVEAETTPAPTTFPPPRRTTKPPVKVQDASEIDFSDFSALSKFQHNFHHSIKQTTTTTEAPQYRPSQSLNEYIQPFLNKVITTTTAAPTTTAYRTRPTAGQPSRIETEDFELKDYASLSKFQKGFTQSPQFENFRGDVEEFTTTRETPAPTIRTTYGTTRRTITRPPPPDAGKVDFSDFSQLSKFQHNFHHSFKETTTAPPKPAVQLNEFQVFLTKPTPARQVTTTTRSPPPTADSAEESLSVFNNYSDLSKFQNDFHKSNFGTLTPTAAKQSQYEEPPRQRLTTTTTTTTTTARPITTTARPTTTTARAARPTHALPDSSKIDFSDFAALSKFQNSFHRSFTEAPTNRPVADLHEQEIPNHEFSDFNTKPRTETQSPYNFQQTTTRRPPVYQSTFRTTFNDVITPAPQTYQQQPTKFDDDFFVRQPSQRFTTDSSEDDGLKPIKFSAPIIYQSPERINPKVTKKSQAFDNFEVETFRPKTKHVEPTKSSSVVDENEELVVSSSARPIRRGGRKRVILAAVAKDDKNFPPYDSQPQYKYSRRVENARFEDRESYSVKERSQVKTDEIFNAEASVFRGPANNNAYYVNEGLPQRKVTQTPTTEVTKPAEEVKPVVATTTTGNVFGRRVRTRGREQEAQGRRVDDQAADSEIVNDSGEAKKSGKTRVVKRLKQKSTTEVSAESDVSSTTATSKQQPSRVRTKTITLSRRLSGGQVQVTAGPVPHQDRPKSLISTTTEPQLITASDEEISIIRGQKDVTTEKSTTRNYLIISREPEKKSEKTKSSEGSKSGKPDYDYTYYDTERDHDYSDISSSFGIRPGKIAASKK